MLLTITFLDGANADALANILKCIDDCQCQISELRTLNHAPVSTGYILADGNWNHIAKLETNLALLDQNLQIGLHLQRLEKPLEYHDNAPYFIEILSANKKPILHDVIGFIRSYGINILEIASSRYPAAQVNSTLFSCKLIIAIPQHQPLIGFREEFLDYCDQVNLDAFLEPIKSKTL